MAISDGFPDARVGYLTGTARYARKAEQAMKIQRELQLKAEEGRGDLANARLTLLQITNRSLID